MKIDNCGTAYAAVKLQIYKQNFAYRFTIYEIALSGRFLGPYPPELPKILPGVVLQQTKTLFENFFEGFEYLWKRG